MWVQPKEQAWMCKQIFNYLPCIAIVYPLIKHVTFYGLINTFIVVCTPHLVCLCTSDMYRQVWWKGAKLISPLQALPVIERFQELRSISWGESKWINHVHPVRWPCDDVRLRAHSDIDDTLETYTTLVSFEQARLLMAGFWSKYGWRWRVR